MRNISKVWGLLTPSEKTRAIGLVFLMLIGMVLEMLGIGMVIPALSAMAGATGNAKLPTLPGWFPSLGEASRATIILFGLVLLLVIYAIKAAFLLFANWRQLTFGCELNNRLARTIYANYLGQPWTFHLQRNAAELIRTFQDVHSVSVLATTILSIAADSLITAGILVLLVWFEPVGALAVGTLLLVATWILDVATRQRSRRWGELVHHHAAVSLKHLVEGLHGAKDVKIYGREAEFINQFDEQRSAFVRMNARQGFLAQMPRLWYELLAVFALCVLAAVMVHRGNTAAETIPILGLFAAAAFRLLPLVNRLANALQSLRFAGPAIGTIQAESAMTPAREPNECRPLKFDCSINFANVSYRYPGSHINAIESICLEIPRGSSVGIIGGSGAGKSTLIDVLLGLLTPTSGDILVDGVGIATNIRGWRRQIGYVPQSIYLCDNTIRRNVAFGLPDELIDDAAVGLAIRLAQLEAFIANLPDGLDTMVGDRGVRLSGGQRQRIGIARALYHNPQILVLDEATSALDGDTERSFMNDIEAMHGSRTTIIVAHRLTTVARCDVLYRLDAGRIVATGSYSELVAS